ncbi:fatty acid--CoA ligase family protein [Polaribacter sp.]|nr:fatty acid--CoA ligase family protein [Polaribacter sp.]
MLNQFKDFKGDAIIYNDISYNYQSLANQIENYKEKIKTLINQNDVVVIDSDYSFYSISLLLALSDFPCIIVPIVRTTDVEFNSKQEAAGVNKILTLTNDILEIINLNEKALVYNKYLDITSENKSGIVLFSSGTTGAPKVMVHDFSKLIQSFKPPRKQKKLRFLLFLMFDHIGGLNTLLNCLNNGVPIIIPKKRTPTEILNLIEKNSVHILPTTPTFLNLMLLNDDIHEFDISSLKMVSYGTERMPRDLLKKVNRLLPKVKLLQTFGTSETGILKTQSKSSSSLYFKIVDEDVDYKIEENQLFIKSKTSVNGYKDLPSDKFTKDGWFATGDIVKLDKEGYMKVEGRLNNVINVGGLKVLPSEVEDVINSISGILDTTVLAKNNVITGQMVIARVVVEKNIDSVQIKRIIKQVCKDSLDKYKRPMKIEISKDFKVTSRFKKINK